MVWSPASRTSPCLSTPFYVSSSPSSSLSSCLTSPSRRIISSRFAKTLVPAIRKAREKQLHLYNHKRINHLKHFKRFKCRVIFFFKEIRQKKKYIHILEIREDERVVSAFAFSLEQNLIWRTISQHPFAGQLCGRDAPVESDLASGRGQISGAGEVIGRSQ